MVECENQQTGGIPKPDFTTYVETWSFKIKRGGRGLICYAQGYDLQEGFFKVDLVYEDKKWILAKVEGDKGQEMGAGVEVEMFRQFAAHKARYLNAKNKLQKGS